MSISGWASAVESVCPSPSALLTGPSEPLGVPKQHLYSSPIGFTEQFAVLSVKSVALAFLFRQHNVSGSRYRELECPPPATSSSLVRLANKTPTECPALPSSSLMPALTYILIVRSPMSRCASQAGCRPIRSPHRLRFLGSDTYNCVIQGEPPRASHSLSS